MPDPDDITGWQRLNETTTTSGRIHADDIVRLKAIGVRHVINLALTDSPGALADEAALLAEAGLDYTHIPVPFDAPDDMHFEQFCDAIRHGEHSVHVHCIMNWRVSAFFYRYNRDLCSMPDGTARALMERHWTPETTQHADGPAWAAFITRRG